MQSPSVKRIRLGAGAGYSGDRLEPAIELARAGQLDYLIFECLAERTIALAQLERLHRPEAGYDPLLGERMRGVLPYLRGGAGRKPFRIITNMGAAHPQAAAQEVRRIARELGLQGLQVAAVTGDDVTAQLRGHSEQLLDIGITPAALGDRLLSANAYLGAQGLVQALRAGAEVVVCGRVADPSLYVAPQLLEFGWADDDWLRLGQATLVGHLMECAGQITGGYFADPGYKDVAGLARLGFPIAELDAEGGVVITKVAGSGGCVSVQTCAEQLLYEVHDPQRYLTPDVCADFSGVHFESRGADRVAVLGAQGTARPAMLKVSVGYRDGWLGEGQMSYGGAGALARAQLAREVVLERLRLTGVQCSEIRADLLGVDALYGPLFSARQPLVEPAEVRLRVVGRCAQREQAVRIGNEVESLYTNGPAGGGGASKTLRQVVAVASLLWPAAQVPVQIHLEAA
jgi:hypothetical protein